MVERTHLDPVCKQHHEGPNCPFPKGGFEDDPASAWVKPCQHKEHKPPSHLVIPEGKIYRHICPACGVQVVLRPPKISF